MVTQRRKLKTVAISERHYDALQAVRKAKAFDKTNAGLLQELIEKALDEHGIDAKTLKPKRK